MLHAKILVACHWCLQVEILDVDGHETCVWCGNDAVEQYFDCEEICCWGSAVARVVDEISSHGDSCVVFVFLSFTADTDNSPVGDITLAFFGDVTLAHEKNGFCSGC